jgi:hypothetical protein
MKPWQPGDPVGMGEVYLPDKKTRAAYGKACRAAVIDSAAKHAISLPTLHRRRNFIDSYPVNAREALKDRVREIWEERNGRV